MNQSNQSIRTNYLIPVKTGYHIVQCEDIMLLEAESNYCHIYLENGSRYFVSRTLKCVSEVLCSTSFVRIHKSFLVNLRFVKSVKKGKQMNVQLINGTNVLVARSQRGNLLHRLHMLNSA